MRSKQYREDQLAQFQRNPNSMLVVDEPVIRRVAYAENYGWIARDHLRAHLKGVYARQLHRITKRAWTVMCPGGGPYNAKMWGSILYAKVDLEMAQLYYAHYLMTREEYGEYG